MACRITIIDGHPDPGPERFCHALSNAYAVAATAAGHEVRRVNLCDLDFWTFREWRTGERASGPATGAWSSHLAMFESSVHSRRIARG